MSHQEHSRSGWSSISAASEQIDKEECRVLLVNEQNDDGDGDFREGGNLLDPRSTASLGSPTAQPSLSQLKLIALGSYWFSLLFFFTSVYAILVPAKAASLSPTSKGSVMGILMSSAAGANTLIVPFVGMLSDHTRGPFGKRKPYILLSAALACGGLLWLPRATDLPDLVASYLMLGIGANMGLPAYFSLLPDNVPLHQRGMASGWSMLFYSLGGFSGGVSMGFLLTATSYEVCSYVIVGVMLGGVAMLLAFSPDSTVDRNKLAAKEAEEAGISADASINLGGQRTHKRPWTLGRVIKATLLAVGKYCYSYFTPFFMGDFMWAWLSTGFFWTGSYTLSNFMQFYYADAFTQPYHIFNAITISNAESAMSVYTGFNVVGTLLFSLLSGKLIDGWFGYRFTDTLGALVVAAGVGVIASSTIYEVTLVGGFLAGCGTGLATSAQMALNSRVLSKNDKNEDVSNAKDMGMMSNNTNLAQILATSVNGFLLDYFKEHLTDGRRTSYVVVYAIGIGYLLLAALLVWRVRGVR